MSTSSSEIEPVIADYLYALIVWAHSSCNRDLIRRVGELRLSFNSLLLLEELRGRRHPPTIGDIAAMLSVTYGAAGRIVDDLDKRGLVERTRDDRDLRARRVEITPRGQDTVLELHRARMHGLERLERELTREEKDDLLDALEPLFDRADLAACLPQTEPK